MNIAFFADRGSPTKIIPPDLYGRGVGGAENALISLTEALAKLGHKVKVYNNPVAPGGYNGVEWLPCHEYTDVGTDVFVNFREATTQVQISRAPLKIFWSCDQYTTGNFASDIFPFVHKAVCISPRHESYFNEMYRPRVPLHVIDLGVRLEDYEREVERIPLRLIYCSMPERGLTRLRAAWDRISRAVPGVSLVITGDHRMWGGGDNTPQYRSWWEGIPNVHYFGAIPRSELVKFQLEAEFQAYPCDYDELFCIASAESQVAGAIPVTSNVGALETTNQFGFQIPGNPADTSWLLDWSDRLIDFLTHDRDAMVTWREEMQAQARERFSWDKIAQQWVQLCESA